MWRLKGWKERLTEASQPFCDITKCWFLELCHPAKNKTNKKNPRLQNPLACSISASLTLPVWLPVLLHLQANDRLSSHISRASIIRGEGGQQRRREKWGGQVEPSLTHSLWRRGGWGLPSEPRVKAVQGGIETWGNAKVWLHVRLQKCHKKSGRTVEHSIVASVMLL